MYNNHLDAYLHDINCNIIIVEMKLYASFSVILYKHFIYLGLTTSSFNLLTYDSLSHKPSIFLLLLCQSIRYMYRWKEVMQEMNTPQIYMNGCLHLDHNQGLIHIEFGGLCLLWLAIYSHFLSFCDINLWRCKEGCCCWYTQVMSWTVHLQYS